MAVPKQQTKKQFSASVFMASDEDLKVYCIPCDMAGQRLPAFGFCQDCDEHLCQNCFSHHKKATLLVNHVLLDKGVMPKTIKRSSNSAYFSRPGDFTKPCLKHMKKIIKFYCQDHQVLLCNVCVTLEHTDEYCHVDYIPDISGQVVDSQEFKDILTHLDDIIQHCQKVKTEFKKVTEKSNTSLSEMMKAVEKYRQDVNKRIDELENEIQNKAKDLHKQNTQRLQTTEAVCDDVTKSVKALSDNIKQQNTSKQADKLFIGLKTTAVEMKDHETCINDLTPSGDVNAYHFELNQVISTVLQNETCLGTIEQRILSTSIQKLETHAQNPKIAQKTPTELDIHVKKPPTSQKSQTSAWLLSAKRKTKEFSHQDEICVLTKGDKKRCWITGIRLLNSHQLVVADNSNKSVKLVDFNSKTVTSEITLSSPPWDIATVTSTQLAVTLPYEGRIEFLNVPSNNISKARSFKVGEYCHGISYYQSKLVVSYRQSEKLEILDMKGNVLKKVTNNFKAPWYVQVNSNSIYVSDWFTRTVTMLSWEGRVMGRYGNFGKCRGLALSTDGTVFVCNSNKHSITEISGDCSTREVVVQDVSKPQAVCWCDESHQLFISISTFSWYDNNIYVYNK